MGTIVGSPKRLSRWPSFEAAVAAARSLSVVQLFCDDGHGQWDDERLVVPEVDGRLCLVALVRCFSFSSLADSWVPKSRVHVDDDLLWLAASWTGFEDDLRLLCSLRYLSSRGLQIGGR